MKRLFLLFFLCVFANAAATTYYVRPDGNDANTGTGTGTGDALATVDHAIDSHAVDGDTVIIAPGVYREAVSLSNGGSAGSIITVRGDPRNESGFAGIVAGPVRITGYTTDDKTDHGNYAVNLNTVDYVTFEDIWFDGGDNHAVYSNFGCDHITFNRCLFVSIGASGCRVSPATDSASYFTFNNCILISPANYGIEVNPQATPTSAELDLEVSINNCIIFAGGRGVTITDRASTYPFAGVDLDSCTILAGSGFQYATTASNNGTIKNKITRCLFLCSAAISTSTTKTVVTEDWNSIFAGIIRSAGESAGANTQTKYSLQTEFGQSALWFGRPIVPFMPISTSPQLGFDGSGANLTTDFLGRMRPSGPGVTSWNTTNSSVGALEYHDFGTKETSVVDSGSSIKLLGPGDHQIIVPVKAQATVLSVKAAFGNLYAGTAPQAVLLASPELGVTTETLTMSETDTNTFETLTFGSQTPSAQGAVIIRLINNSTAYNGQAWFDTVTRNY